MIIEFINASFEQVAGKGANSKGYGKALVTFKGDRGVKTQTVLSFANPMVYSALEDLKQGDKIDVTMAKNASGFWQWESITPATGDSSPQKESTPSGAATPYASNPSKPTTYAARDFESKEERAQRQALIVRQSSLSNAISVLTVGSKSAPAPTDVFNLAEQFVGWVYQGPPEPPKAASSGSGFDDLDNDIPY